jgi:hypothetical protein
VRLSRMRETCALHPLMPLRVNAKGRGEVHTRTHAHTHRGSCEGPVGVQTVQDWRNRCTLRMSVHTLWDPASINLEFQYDTYTGVREHDS